MPRISMKLNALFPPNKNSSHCLLNTNSRDPFSFSMTLCVLILSIYKWQPYSSLLSQQDFTVHALDWSLKHLPVLLYSKEYQVYYIITLFVLFAVRWMSFDFATHDAEPFCRLKQIEYILLRGTPLILHVKVILLVKLSTTRYKNSCKMSSVVVEKLCQV